MAIRYPAVCCLLLLSVAMHGQVKFTTVVDESTIARNQLLHVEYVVENATNIENFNPPSFRNFIVIQGPIHSSGQTLINGTFIQYKALVFIVQPRTTGKLIIPGATATIDGKRRQSDAVAIEVTKSQSSNPGATRRPLRFNMPEDRVEADEEFVLYPNESVVDKIKKNLFVKVEVNKKTCYVNEPITATYKLYSCVRSDSRVVKRPSYNGFSLYDIKDPDLGNQFIETVNGKRYNVHIIRKSQLFPLQSGQFVLDPVEVENTVRFVKANSEQDTYLEQYHDPYAETIEHTIVLASNSVDIVVKPLPAMGQPVTFDGAVGAFSLSAVLKHSVIKAGEANSLAVAIKGNGNLPMINAPAVNWPSEVEAFDPSAKEDLHPEIAPLGGTKTFEYLFTPKDTGMLVIPPVQFSYFDPSTQSYKTDSTEAISLHIVPGDKKTTAKKAASGSVSMPSSQNMWLWIAGGALATLLVISAVVVSSRRSNRKSFTTPVVIPTANPVVVPVRIDPLEKARRMLPVATSSMFIREVESVVWNEVAEKLQIPPVALNQPQVIATLEKRAADTSTVNLFRELMHDCEYALYIPGQSAEDLQGLLSKAERFLEKMNTLQ